MGDLARALAELNLEGAVELSKQRLAVGADPLDLIEECRMGMDIVGECFSRCEYYLAELIVATDIFQKIIDFVKPLMPESRSSKPLGKIVIGTVQGDIHDIGKNIVRTVLSVAGYEVIDLGVDVPPGVFLEKAQEVGASILGMSSLLTTGFESMKQTVELFDKEGLRGDMKFLVGGASVNEMVREHVGADIYAKDAVDALNRLREMRKESEKG